MDSPWTDDDPQSHARFTRNSWNPTRINLRYFFPEKTTKMHGDRSDFHSVRSSLMDTVQSLTNPDNLQPNHGDFTLNRRREDNPRAIYPNSREKTRINFVFSFPKTRPTCTSNQLWLTDWLTDCRHRLLLPSSVRTYRFSFRACVDRAQHNGHVPSVSANPAFTVILCVVIVRLRDCCSSVSACVRRTVVRAQHNGDVSFVLSFRCSSFRPFVRAVWCVLITLIELSHWLRPLPLFL